jgi:hypothetical protein
MTAAHEIISLQSHTLGSIGQIVKDASLLRDSYSKDDAFDEIKRIYDGYVTKIKELI